MMKSSEGVCLPVKGYKLWVLLLLVAVVVAVSTYYITKEERDSHYLNRSDLSNPILATEMRSRRSSDIVKLNDKNHRVPNLPYKKADGGFEKPERYSREKLKGLLFDFATVAEKHNLTYWLSEGTALGVYRDGQIVDGDTDVDIGVRIEYLETLIKVVDELLSSYNFKVMRVYPFSIVRDKHYIDIDITGIGLPCMTGIYPNYCDHILPYLVPHEISMKKYKDSDRSFPCPPEKYYVYMYGSDWRTPKKGFKHRDLVKQNKKKK